MWIGPPWTADYIPLIYVSEFGLDNIYSTKNFPEIFWCNVVPIIYIDYKLKYSSYSDLISGNFSLVRLLIALSGRFLFGIVNVQTPLSFRRWENVVW